MKSTLIDGTITMASSKVSVKDFQWHNAQCLVTCSSVMWMLVEKIKLYQDHTEPPKIHFYFHFYVIILNYLRKAAEGSTSNWNNFITSNERLQKKPMKHTTNLVVYTRREILITCASLWKTSCFSSYTSFPFY